MSFQTAVNYNYALGVIGTLAFNDGGMRAAPYNLVSNPNPNLIGNAYTVSSAAAMGQAAAAPIAGTAQVGGTGQFAGILVGLHEYTSLGTASGALNPSITLPDNSIGELLTRGFPFVNLPGPANPGDLVTFDPATGNLNSITPTTKFTAAIVATAGGDVMTVSAVSAGRLGVGQPVTGAGVSGGTFIAALGTGKGYTGTYILNTIDLQTVAGEAMTAPNIPDLAFVASAASIATSVGVDTLTVTTLTSGQLSIGTQVFGTNVAPNTVITAFGSGTGGTGTYTLNTSGQTVAGEAMNGPANLFVPRAEVYRYQPNTTGGNAIIQLSN